MVDEYISRRALLELYVDGKYDTAEYHVSVPVIIQNIKDIPAADVRAVKRGRWMAGIHGSVSIVCSVCGYEWYVASTMSQNYCPNCGADMRGASDV